MQRKINVILLLFSLIGGVLGFAIGELVLGKLSEGWPRFVVVGLYFGIIALCIGLSCLIAELIAPRLNGASWRQRYTDLSWKLLVPATLALLFVVGGLVQLIYGLQFGGSKPVKDIVLVIDNSGSMLETDPDNERYAAAKQLISNMESDNRVAVVVFHDTAELLQPFASVGTQAEKDQVNAAIDALEPTNGGTNFSLALAESMKTIMGKENGRRGTMVILLSDGFSESSLEQQIADYQAQQIAVNTVGLSVVDARGADLLQDIADSTGGSYYDVTEANGISLVFQNIYDKLDKQTLLTERTGRAADSTFYTVLRILSLGIIGAAIGVSLGLLFDNRFLAVSFGAGGIVGGLLAGLILDFGLSGQVLTDAFSRLAAVLMLAAIIGLFTLIVPIRDNNAPKARGGGRKNGINGRSAAGMGERTKDSRSHGF
ncbi:vWA domain-containing protein [Paenibacillus sp. LHD-38]|uniref:vWA domain-containing protein n=1 Tax=Paenibacillus sp. LHD-38 TaxID=3072143 RepID=UPI00280D3F56|nr:vWA domain-containing protein [Paenibacillus sp. LHD-38]MDQ8737199.1 vWA domain-containing protein [Paenibacillus sp. LHD-38]